MIKTLVVDDDFLVRMFLKQLIDWGKQGFEWVGDACSGEEALELIDQYSPELIITDISMPGMDGIELIERVRARMPDCYIIALSCHGEFDYVKEAMKRGADEYVLKNLLDAPGLCKQLDMARTKLKNAARQAEQTDKLRQLAAKGTEMLRFELLQNLLRDEPFPLEEQRSCCKEAGIDGSFRACAVLAVAADTVRSNALPQVCGQFCRGKPAFCLPEKENSCYILLDLSRETEENARNSWLRSFAERLYGGINEYLNVCPRMGMSDALIGEENLHQAAVQAQQAIRYAFYDNRIHDTADLERAADTLPERAHELLRRLPAMSEEGMFERIYDEGRQILEECRRIQAPPDEVRRWFGELLQITGIDDEAPDSMEDCLHALDEMTRHLVDERGGGNPAIQQAAAYLREHFAQSVSLAAVAAEVHLNPAYLSYLFKREMGVNFSDYLQNCRMEHMKRLLRESEQPLKECAIRAGFADYRNFCKLFKKQTGLRPAQYRSINRIQETE